MSSDKKAKVVLINPPFLSEQRYGDLKDFGPISEPLGIAYLAASLEKHNYPVSIIDSAVLRMDIPKIVQKLREEKPDLVGISILTTMYGIVKELVKAIKHEMPDCKIILGGAHVIALPKETLLDIKEADYACVGEGEHTIVELADFLSYRGDVSEIKGLVYRDEKGKVVFNQPREFERDLDKFPPPARHLLPMQEYRLTISRIKEEGYCPTLIIARGCPFDCSFCARTFGRSFRHHSIERIITEFKDLIDKYLINQINIEADNLTVNKDFLKSLCRTLIDEGINRRVQWTCASRVDTVDAEMLRLMKEAGCWEISYGIESGSQRLLDIINKGISIEQIEKTVALTKKIGISVRGFFMLGLPSETKEESWQTINFAKRLDPLWAQFTVTTPYPGTRLFNQLKKQGKIRTFDWNNYNTWAGWADRQEVPFIPEGRTINELKNLQKQAMISFYLRPKPILRFLKKVNSWKIFKRYFLSFWILVKNQFRIWITDNCQIKKC
jgi:radical SAM superfamily enzyme YgiQ (UPF0313 family)